MNVVFISLYLYVSFLDAHFESFDKIKVDKIHEFHLLVYYIYFKFVSSCESSFVLIELRAFIFDET